MCLAWYTSPVELLSCKRFTNYTEKTLVIKTQAKTRIYVSNKEAFTAL